MILGGSELYLEHLHSLKSSFTYPYIRELYKTSALWFFCKSNPNVLLSEKQVLSNLKTFSCNLLNKNFQKIFCDFLLLFVFLLTLYAWHSFTMYLLSCSLTCCSFILFSYQFGLPLKTAVLHHSFFCPENTKW